MRCKKCKRKSASEFCDSCFLRIINKRLLKHLKRYKITKHHRLLVLDKVSLSFMSRLHLNIVFKPKKDYEIDIWDLSIIDNKNLKKAKFSYILLPLTLEHLLQLHMQNISAGKKTKPIPKKIIFLFEPLLFSEFKRYTKLKKLRIQIKKPKNELIDSVEKMFPGTKYSTYNAFKSLRQNE